MKVKGKLVIAAGAGALLASLSVYAESNGGGYNGPTMTGDSIPIETDRKITEADIDRVELYCQEPVLISVFEQIFRTSFGPKEGRITRKESPFGWYALIGQQTYLKDRSTWNSPLWAVHRLYVEPSYPTGGIGFHAIWEATYAKNELLRARGWYDEDREIKTRLHYDPAKQERKLKVDFPSFAYQSVRPEARYDDWGNEVWPSAGNVVVKNLRIQLPERYGPKVRMLNYSTGQPLRLPIDVNLVEYANCLKTQIQK